MGGFRITKRVLQNQVLVLNRKLGLPPTPWTITKEGRTANVGHLLLEVDDAGDGVNRYHIRRIMNERGGQELMSPVGTGPEIAGYLKGVLDTLDGRFKVEVPA
jgi:hypothetical protein